MRIPSLVSRIAIAVACLLLVTGVVSAGEKKLLHSFYFTAIEAATDADWQAFFRATDELPGKIPGLSHVWYGKLARPMKVGDQIRQWGVCMEFTDQAALDAYATNPAHDAWSAAYSKVRVPGTTTVNFMGK
jgi:hypothetical protein